jgi:hypothetical protein
MYTKQCQECRRLTTEYLSAMAEYVQLDNHRRLTVLSPDDVDAIIQQTDRAAAERYRRMEALARHEETAHPPTVPMRAHFSPA